MAVRYYPANKIDSNQYTAGGLFTANGQEYVGYYYETFDGQAFTGKTPTDVNANVPLERTLFTGEGSGATSSKALTILNDGPEVKLNLLLPYYPNPTAEDYKKGYITRYFAKKVNEKEVIIEISQEKYMLMKSNKTSLEDYLYQVTDLFWKISGPLNDDRVNKQYPVAGILQTNKRLVETKNKTFPGLKEYIGGEYSKYAVPS